MAALAFAELLSIDRTLFEAAVSIKKYLSLDAVMHLDAIRLRIAGQLELLESEVFGPPPLRYCKTGPNRPVARNRRNDETAWAEGNGAPPPA